MLFIALNWVSERVGRSHSEVYSPEPSPGMCFAVKGILEMQINRIFAFPCCIAVIVDPKL